MDELNELEAEMAGEELDNLEIGAGAIDAKQDKQKVVVGASKNEEDELKALEQMMAWFQNS